MSDEQLHALNILLSEAGTLEVRTIQLLEDAEMLGDNVIIDRLKAVRDLLSDVQDDVIVFERMASVKNRKS